MYPRNSSFTDATIEYQENGKRREAVITLTRKDGRAYGNCEIEYMVRTKEKGNRFVSRKSDENGKVCIEIPPKEEFDQYIYLMLHDEKLKYPFYFYVPPQYDYTLGFYPEGGHLIANTKQKIAFKAESTTIEPPQITGYVINGKKDTLCVFKSEHEGMGYFNVSATVNDSLQVITYDAYNNRKVFNLPLASSERVSLSVWKDERNLYCHLLIPENKEIKDPFYLLAHTRGNYIGAWSIERDSLLKLPVKQFSDGITQLTLVCQDSILLSERLVFINQPEPVFQLAISGKASEIRSQIKLGLRVLDEKWQALKGNFSISITDDYSVPQDTFAKNIKSELLLSSDLKGHIVNPAYYFQTQNSQCEKHLDLLMLTHGWRQFDSEYSFRDKPDHSLSFQESTMRLSGKVTKLFNRPATGEKILISHMEGSYRQIVCTDSIGCFSAILPEISSPNHPQITFEAKVLANRDTWKYKIDLDESFDFPNTILPYSHWCNISHLNMNHLKNIQELYIMVNGEKVYQLPEVSVLSSFPLKGWQSFRTIEQERIEQMKSKDVEGILIKTPGVFIERYENGGVCRVRMITKDKLNASFVEKGMGSIANRVLSPQTKQVNLFVNGKRITDIEEILRMNSQHVRSIDLIKRSKTNAIHLTTFRANEPLPSSKTHIARVKLYAYNKNVQFYAPKYSTEESRKIVNSDKRTTIHWEPNIRLNEKGEAGLSFYTADRPSTYTIVIEGVTDDGKVCRYVKQIK